jgi:hypothetical protein
MKKADWLGGLSRRAALKGMAAGVAARGAPALKPRARAPDTNPIGVVKPIKGAGAV